MEITPSRRWRCDAAILQPGHWWAPRGKRRYGGVSQQELPQLKLLCNGAGGISLAEVHLILFQTSVSFRHPRDVLPGLTSHRADEYPSHFQHAAC